MAANFEPSFDQLPVIVSSIWDKLVHIEKLLQDHIRQPEKNIDEILSVHQAAILLKLSVPTMYGLVHRREIPYSKRGKRLYFSRIELIDWIKSSRRKTLVEIQESAEDYLSRPKRIGGKQ
jgi:excisionase family DNA binding protein